MAKMSSTLKNMAVVLGVIALLSSFLLALVYRGTAPVIEHVQKEKQAAAIREVLPLFDNDPVKDAITFEDVPELVFFPALKGDSLVGVAVRTYTDKGFSGRFWLMAGFLPDGTIHNVVVIEHKETPGLGANMTTEKFRAQFRGKNPAEFPLVVKKDGGPVDALTAATISSRAFCDALQRAYDALMAHLPQIESPLTSKEAAQ
ncbi:electron transport complex, RnfABCDGE type, G subunit [Spirochaeta thermophila DSM 6578]|uniref:Ion-translocating oxidoreductase complex subunit G n=1 Tax=Winmispira thermophila (strain ATCC 700085 / DSM 6578 / Z-1203) TaxID=869211 RepID=G0GBR9_WINT7|nr:RnfABCDGE type electron transport complex subunit G [Spirochaeta thermophila]AEJ61147.1 electron transport complex, RnfABCDGE type, G subunit [Spirochaeta thermophila DSM 6578]